MVARAQFLCLLLTLVASSGMLQSCGGDDENKPDEEQSSSADDGAAAEFSLDSLIPGQKKLYRGGATFTYEGTQSTVDLSKVDLSALDEVEDAALIAKPFKVAIEIQDASEQGISFREIQDQNLLSRNMKWGEDLLPGQISGKDLESARTISREKVRLKRGIASIDCIHWKLEKTHSQGGDITYEFWISEEQPALVIQYRISSASFKVEAELKEFTQAEAAD